MKRVAAGTLGMFEALFQSCTSTLECVLANLTLLSQEWAFSSGIVGPPGAWSRASTAELRKGACLCQRLQLICGAFDAVERAGVLNTSLRIFLAFLQTV